MNTNKETNNLDTPSKADKVVLLIMTIVVALLIPVLLQVHLNVIFRNLFNPQGCIVLVPGLRVMSTLVCYGLTAAAGRLLLRISGIRKRWLTILFFVLTFLWTGLVAAALYLAID
ncbi:MAG: hypothetical protein IKO75_01285 [Bacteroidales bacterium]|nr:hypothetical protein [Bacteroidales bacterium]